ncbi:MAG TPA: hypothetical protein VGF45_22415 [Polyangia bacterium]
MFRAVLARKNRFANVATLATLGWLVTAATLTSGCGDDSSRVLLVFSVQEAAFRPDNIEIIWGVVGGDQRTARVPATGSLPPMDGDNLGEVLIILDDSQPEPRRFIARGKRGDERVSGHVATVTWTAGRETMVPMRLGCYDDPGIPEPVPACRGGNNTNSSTLTDGGSGN